MSASEGPRAEPPAPGAAAPPREAAGTPRRLPGVPRPRERAATGATALPPATLAFVESPVQLLNVLEWAYEEGGAGGPGGAGTPATPAPGAASGPAASGPAADLRNEVRRDTWDDANWGMGDDHDEYTAFEQA
ncbi:hypothetical protein ACWCQH_23345, partial [Streptomyces sp. NPDC002067]